MLLTISTPLHDQRTYCTFYSTTFIWSYCSDSYLTYKILAKFIKSTSEGLVLVLTLLYWYSYSEHFFHHWQTHTHTCTYTPVWLWRQRLAAGRSHHVPAAGPAVRPHPSLSQCHLSKPERQRAFTALTYITTPLCCLSDSCVSVNLRGGRGVTCSRQVPTFWE